MAFHLRAEQAAQGENIPALLFGKGKRAPPRKHRLCTGMGFAAGEDAREETFCRDKPRRASASRFSVLSCGGIKKPSLNSINGFKTCLGGEGKKKKAASGKG